MIMTSEMRAPFDKMDHKLGQAKGLASAMNQLAAEYSGLNNADPAAHSIMVLLDLQEAIWDAVRKVDPSGGCDGGSEKPKSGFFFPNQ